MLIFTSFGFRSPIVREKLKKYVLTENKTVLMVPFAGFHVENCASGETDGLVEYGFLGENIFVYHKDMIESGIPIDYVYVPGGDTFKLLKHVQDNGMIPILKQLVANGSVYIGASAGAELATTDLAYVSLLEDNNYPIADFKGIGLVDDIVLPHADQREISLKVNCKAIAGPDRKLTCIANDSVAVYEKDETGAYKDVHIL